MYGLLGQPARQLGVSRQCLETGCSGTPTDRDWPRRVPMLYRVWDIDNFDADTLKFTITVTAPDLKADLWRRHDCRPRCGGGSSGGLAPAVRLPVAMVRLRYSLSGLPEGLVFNAAMAAGAGRGDGYRHDRSPPTAVTDADGDAATLPFAVTIISSDLKADLWRHDNCRSCRRGG